MTSRKDELLDKWVLQTLTYNEGIELLLILEDMAKEADDGRKALIGVATLGLGLYFLTNKGGLNG